MAKPASQLSEAKFHAPTARPGIVARTTLVREIGERVYVSRHTVKTQAISVYRKLGVSSRSKAITRMHGLGLLAHA